MRSVIGCWLLVTTVGTGCRSTDVNRPSASSAGHIELCSAGNSSCCQTVHDDAARLLPDVWEDAKGTVNLHNGVILGVSLAAAIGLRQDVDDHVRDNVARHPDRWGDGSELLGALGDPIVQVPALLAVYASGVATEDPEVHDLSLTLIRAYGLAGVANTVVKGIANTDRPDDDWNGGQWGFPSFHAASTFAMAGVLDEYYGPWVGMPSYVLAGLVGWSRIDQQDHDLSDVVFGSALGLVIGKSVAGRHLTGDGRARLLPWVHPLNGTPGLRCDVTF